MTNLQKNRVAIVFAGGKSSRMGQDKSLMPFKGYKTITEYQYRRLSKIFGKVYISTKSNKFDFEAHLIYDKYPQSSPLVAIVSIFETIKDNKIFILSVDAPFVDSNIIDKLYKDIDNQSVIAKSPNGDEPLCGVYNRSIYQLAKEELANNNHRLNSLLKKSNSKFIYFNNREAFINLNYKEDYDKYNV